MCLSRTGLAKPSCICIHYSAHTSLTDRESIKTTGFFTTATFIETHAHYCTNDAVGKRFKVVSQDQFTCVMIHTITAKVEQNNK